MAVLSKTVYTYNTLFFTGQRCQTRRPLNRASSVSCIGSLTPRLSNPASFFTASVVGSGAGSVNANENTITSGGR